MPILKHKKEDEQLMAQAKGRDREQVGGGVNEFIKQVENKKVCTSASGETTAELLTTILARQHCQPPESFRLPLSTS